MISSWNKIVYKFWSPVYDRIFNSGIFLETRKQIFKEINFTNHQKILFVGVGTGADLELIDHGSLDITAIDFSLEMLNKAKEKFDNSTITFIEMDAQNLEFSNDSFDFVVASLILSVVPDPQKCFQEMTRVVKGHGHVLIFDKFAPKEKELSLFKKIIRPFVRLAGTDIGVKFENVYNGATVKLTQIHDIPIMFNGMYRKILVKKLKN